MIKKLWKLLLTLSLSIGAAAEIVTVGNSYHLATVQMLEQLHDDDKVILEGHLSKNLGGNVYLFSDATGKVKVEIETEQFNGEIFLPENRIRVIGEVDKNKSALTIDIDVIERVK